MRYLIMKPTAVVLLLLGIFAPALSLNVTKEHTFHLDIVHMNDFHARFEETNDAGGTCKTNNCIGGFSRLYNVVDRIVQSNPDTVLLNAGDNFQGTLWYNIFKWNVTKHFLNLLPFDAITLGNHEFDDGVQGVVPFMKNLVAPVVVANINDTLEPSFQGLYSKSVVIERKGRKIGIIGVITSTTQHIASPGNLTFYDEIESVNKEAERLAREEGVFTNIVLSHCGYDVEQEMARRSSGKISAIVGGHSHTFLYSGEPSPGPDEPRGPYPTLVKRAKDGKSVLVVQASAYCKYLGNMTVYYDEDGNLLDFEGAPIFLDNALPQSEKINNMLQPWREEIHQIGEKVLGQSLVRLYQGDCRFEECLLGNFVTDVMVETYADLAKSGEWAYAALAVFNAGGLRTTIEKGNVTYMDMIASQPFGNTFDVGDMLGKHIKEMFEFALHKPYHFGRQYVSINLLQVSGFRLTLDIARPVGERVVSVMVRCHNCTIPTYHPLDLERSYRLIVPSFLTFGGDGFVVIQNNLKNVQSGPFDMDMFMKYLEEKSPIFEEIGGRIAIEGRELISFRDLDT